MPETKQNKNGRTKLEIESYFVENDNITTINAH